MSVTQPNHFIALLGGLGCVLAVAFLQSGCGSCTLEAFAVVVGEVRDAQTGDPLENALVVCQNEAGRGDPQRTESSGVFFCNTPPVRILVSRKGYQSRELDVEEVDVDRCGDPEDGALELDIALEPNDAGE